MAKQRDEILIFDKESGRLDRHPAPRRRFPWSLVVVLVFLFLVGTCTVVNLQQAKAARISDFTTSQEGNYLKVCFCLANSKEETVTAKGTAQLSFFDDAGKLIYKESFPFSKDDFKRSSGRWTYTLMIPLEKVSDLVPKNESIGKILSSRCALGWKVGLQVTRDDGKTLPFIIHAVVASEEQGEKMIKLLYYEKEVRTLQAELDKQWPFKVAIEDYIRVGKYGWMVVRRTGSEIVFYPYDKVYSWYLLQSTDDGHNWDIPWRGASCPSLKITFLSDTEVRVTIPAVIYHTEDGGTTWHVQRQ